MSGRVDIEWYEDRNPVKITYDGAEGGGLINRRLTSEEAEAHRERERAAAFFDDPTIEQRDGRFYKKDAVERMRSGNRLAGEALDLIIALWNMPCSRSGGTAAASQEPASEECAGSWNGLQAIAWLTTGNRDVVAKLRERIEFRPRARKVVTDVVHPRHMVQVVRHEVAANYCKCHAGKSRRPQECICVDEAQVAISAEILRGTIINLSGEKFEPLRDDNAWGSSFKRQFIERLAQAYGGPGAS